MDGVLAAGRPTVDSPRVSMTADRASGARELAVLATTVSLVVAVTLFGAVLVLLARGLSGGFAVSARSAAFLVVLASAVLAVAGTAVRACLRADPRSFRPGAGRLSGIKPVAPALPTESPAAARIPVATAPSPMPAPWADGRLVQRLERYERTASDGSAAEAAVGRVVARFEEGARTAVVHVGFCPPFNAIPRVTVSTECDGLEVALSAAEVLPWGVRIEGRLEEPAEAPVDVEVDLVAVPPGVT